MTDTPFLTVADVARLVVMTAPYVRDKLSRQRGFPEPYRLGNSLRWKREDIERMPAPAMELLCIVLAVGTVEGGPYVPPGDWMRPWVRDELCLWFRSGPRLFFTGGDVPAYTVTTLGLPGGRS